MFATVFCCEVFSRDATFFASGSCFFFNEFCVVFEEVLCFLLFCNVFVFVFSFASVFSCNGFCVCLQGVLRFFFAGGLVFLIVFFF